MKAFTKAIIYYALLGLLVWVVLVRVTDFAKKPNTQNYDAVNSSSVATPLGYIARVETSKGEVYVEMQSDRIILNPFENSIGEQIVIKKDDYTQLFEQGVANSSVLMATEYIDPQSGDVFIKLSTNQPDHFGIASTYVLLVNPISGTIREGANDYQTEKQ